VGERGKLSAGEEFNRSKPSLSVWHVVPKEDCLIEDKRPKLQIRVGMPVNNLMEEHCLGPLGDSVDGAFSSPVLMMGADAGVVNFLILVGAVTDDLMCHEWSVISMIGSDGKAVILGKTFKGMFSLEGLAYTQRV
jgi:hypothetical protein